MLNPRNVAGNKRERDGNTVSRVVSPASVSEVNAGCPGLLYMETNTVLGVPALLQCGGPTGIRQCRACEGSDPA